LPFIEPDFSARGKRQTKQHKEGGKKKKNENQSIDVFALFGDKYSLSL
jgi:hypothetical protein